MRTGCCLNMAAARPGLAEWELVADFARAGCDFVDFSVNTLAQCSEAEFYGLCACMRDNGMQSVACNSLFLPSHKLMALHPGDAQLEMYLRRALERAQALGVRYFGFGSGASRHIPAGMPREEGEAHLRRWLRHIARMTDEYGVTLLLEPLCRMETNWLNTLEEAQAFRQSLTGSGVLLLLDYFHMKTEGEALSHIADAAGAIAHVHIAAVPGRGFPSPEERADYEAFFAALQTSGYEGCLSIEAYADDPRGEIREALALLRDSTG